MRGGLFNLVIDQSEDIIEEALNLFRPNSFSKSFDIRGPADRTLVYLLLLIGDLLGRLRPDQARSQGLRTLHTHLTGTFCVPGEPGFPLNGMFPAVVAGERDALQSYLAGVRMECATRLMDRVYGDGGDEALPNQWWMSFCKRRFMNKSLQKA